MKRICLIILLVVISLSGMAQTIGEAFYIYRNDGQFNAFFRDEVISIEYSYEGISGNTYDEIVTQIVNTVDSVYKIPLAAIDSISFIQPETNLQPNVVQMAQNGLMNYLIAVDGMTLLFETTIPNELRPKVDNILLYTDFESPLLEEGFVGRVLKTEMTTDAFRVECDSIYDIFDIFEQLTSIEIIGDNNNAIARRRVDGEWNPGKKPLNFNLGYAHDLSDGQFSLSGSVNGAYAATLIYNITKKEQYVNLRINHEWQYGAHLNFKTNKGFNTLIGSETSLPAIRFPAIAPVLKFQIAGAPFVKGEGNMELDFSLNSPIQSYVSQIVYNNGTFSGWNHRQSSSEGNIPSFETAFSLNGSLQIGYKVKFWLGVDVSIKGIANDFLKLGTGLDLYIGPKLTGDFSMKLGTENPVNYYSTYKDSKFDLSLLTVDYEFFGEAALAGHKTPKGIFCNGTVQSPWNHEWYIMPEFSDLTIQKNEEKLSATINCTPSRDILFPLELGMGVYDETGELKQLAFEKTKYKRENEGYTINQSFYSLQREKEYEARPMIRILGGEVSAFPTKKFKLEKHIEVQTLSASNVEKNSATIAGKVCGYVAGLDNGEVGFYYNTTGNPSRGNGQSVYVGRLSYFSDGEFLTSLSDLEQGKTYYYRAYYYCDGEYQYGETCSLTTPVEWSCPDNNHPHWIDLGLPSGTQWCCCNGGASSPEDFGGFYELEEIASMAPSLEQINELIDACTYTYHITILGSELVAKFVGPSGTIYIPCAGAFWWGEYYREYAHGDYWSSTEYGGVDAAIFEISEAGPSFWSLSAYSGCRLPVRPVRIVNY